MTVSTLINMHAHTSSDAPRNVFMLENQARLCPQTKLQIPRRPLRRSARFLRVVSEGERVTAGELGRHLKTSLSVS